MQTSNRIHGLGTLRAAAIILVYIYHLGFIAHKPVFDIGWIGVDLFFVLSRYLIGNQIFTDIAHKRTFSFKTFMMRRLWRTLPNYIVVLALYIWIDEFHANQILPPLWKMLTFTANFGLLLISALSPNSILHRVKIPFAERIAVLSFAVYLIQKPLDHLTAEALIKYNLITKANLLMFICTALVSILGGWVLYLFIKTPSLYLRDKIYSKPKL